MQTQENKWMTFEDVMNLPYGSKVFSESERKRYQIVYNNGKLVMKTITPDGKLGYPREFTKDNIEGNFFH